MFGDMMGKLQEMQQKTEEIKNRLDTVYVTGESGSGAVKVIATGNRQIKSVELSDELMSEDREYVEDLLVLALNKALDNANSVHEQEMKSAASGMLPGLGGLF